MLPSTIYYNSSIMNNKEENEKKLKFSCFPGRFAQSDGFASVFSLPEAPCPAEKYYNLVTILN